MRAIFRAGIAACLTTILLAIVTASAARAADLGAPPPAPIIAGVADDPVTPQWHRTGFYVGGMAGYDIAELKADDFNFAGTGLQAGLFAGAQWRLQKVVLGIEGDYMWTDVKGTISPLALSSSTHYLATIRGRVGVPLGPVLVYATAGPAFTDNNLGVTGLGASSNNLYGVAFGGGIELDIGKTVFVRGEALHYAFPDKTVTLGPALLSSSDQQTTVRLGVGFHLN